MIRRKRNLIRRTAGSKTKKWRENSTKLPRTGHTGHALATGTRSRKHALQHHPILVLAVPVELQLVQGRPLPHNGMGRASSVDFFLAGAAGALDFLAGAGAQLLGRVRAPVSFGQGLARASAAEKNWAFFPSKSSSWRA